MRFIKLLSLFSLLISPIVSFAEIYQIDADHSKIGFKVRHLGISWVPGTFNKFEGTISFDPKKINSAETQVRIQANSIDTQHEKRDAHLKNEDFLAVTKFPEIQFKSKQISNISENNFDVLGELTLHGVTKQVALKVEYNGIAKDHLGNERIAFSGTAKIDRQNFGVSFGKILDSGVLLVGNEVLITLEIEGVRKL